MNRARASTIVQTILILLALPGAAAAERPAEPWIPGIEELARLDRLPMLRPSIHVASVSSYDRTGGNDDGFSGTHSFVRKEPEGLVIADLEGPGVVTRIWTPTPTDDTVEFLFDGEEKPSLQVGFREMFLGKKAPFLAPLVGYGAGGFYSYVPLPFRKALKIRVRAERVQFYQINHARYPEGTPLSTLTVDPSPAELALRERARDNLAAAGSDISGRLVPEGCEAEVVRSTARLEPGKRISLFEAETGGRIVGLRLSPASAFSGKGRDIVLRISFDGEPGPAVLCPAGDFFGYDHGEPAMRSLFVGTAGDVNYCYLPMPFDRSSKVELVSERPTGPPLEIRSEVVFAKAPRSSREGRLYAVWRRENPTTVGKPFTFLRTEGRGHIVGCVLQTQGFESGKTLFFEGDDQTTIDGQLVIQGTGSEDFFNGGWYDVPDRWEKRIGFPLSGCLGYQKHLGRTGAYRFFIADAYAYEKSILQTIEHGGTGNSIPTDYCAVTYLYSAERPTAEISLPPLVTRGVVDLEKIIFPAWWQIPIQSFCFQNGTLGRVGEKVGSEDVRFLSLKATGDDWFGPPFISLVCELPAAGKYAVSIEAVRGPSQGRVQMFRNEVPAGDAVDLFATSREKATVPLGTIDAVQGNNNLMIKLIGKNEKSAGLGLDLVHVICEKVR